MPDSGRATQNRIYDHSQRILHSSGVFSCGGAVQAGVQASRVSKQYSSPTFHQQGLRAGQPYRSAWGLIHTADTRRCSASPIVAGLCLTSSDAAVGKPTAAVHPGAASCWHAAVVACGAAAVAALWAALSRCCAGPGLVPGPSLQDAHIVVAQYWSSCPGS
jgi:hypothetical protein